MDRRRGPEWTLSEQAFPRFADAELTVEQWRAKLRADPLGTAVELRGVARTVGLPTTDGRRLVMAFDPPLITAALAKGVRTHRELLREHVGSGLFVAPTGEAWRSRRDLLQPLFTASAVRARAHTVATALDDCLGQGRPDHPGEVDLAALTQRLSTWVILRTVDPALPVDTLAHLAALLADLVDYLDARLFAPDTLTVADDARFRAAKAELTGFVAAPPRTTGVLAEVAGRVDRLTRAGVDLHAAPQEVVCEELLSLFIAGVETMGALLTWCLWHLGRHDEARRRCAAEAAALAPGTADERALATGFPFTRAVVLEALRLAPPAWALRRVFDEPTEAAGMTFRPGDTVLVSSYATHRDPQLWPEPDRFRPERFLGRMPAAGTFFPFGGGPHQCIGRQFTLLEAQLAVAALLRRHELRLCPAVVEPTLRPRIALTLQPSPRIMITHL